MLTLYEDPISGNCYKIRLVAAHLGIPLQRVKMDITKGVTRTSEFLVLNPNGRVPLLQLENGRTLSESHAIIWYLAEGSQLIPDDKFARAKVLQWMSFEQYNLEPNVATLRFLMAYKGQSKEDLGPVYDAKYKAGWEALSVLEQGLEGRDWLVGDAMTLADIALYGYVHVAEEGPFSLADYANIRSWCARIAARPGHIPIDGLAR